MEYTAPQIQTVESASDSIKSMGQKIGAVTDHNQLSTTPAGYEDDE